MKKLNYSSFSQSQRKNLFYLPYEFQEVKALFQMPGEKIDWGLKLINIREAWRVTRGAGVKVAILDTGVEEHVDLKGAIVAKEDFTGTDPNCYDSCKHGTHVAGIIGARANEVGVIGVAPECELFIGKVFSDTCFAFNDWLIKAIYHSINVWNVDIISISGGTTYNDPELLKAIQVANAKGKFVVCAGGNRSFLGSLEYPGRYNETISVGSIDPDLTISSDSSKGEQLDVVAPGKDICSTYPGDIYARKSGTSMATPFVSGIIALMLAKHRDHPDSSTPITNLKELRAHIKRISIDLGPKGKDCNYGFGLYNPDSLPKIDLANLLETLDENDLTISGYRKLESYLKLKNNKL